MSVTISKPEPSGSTDILCLQKQGKERASKRAQTTLRDVCCAPLGQREVRKLYHAVKSLSNLC